MAELTSEAVEASMDRFDLVGEEEFRRKRGFGPARDYWVISPHRTAPPYPTKPIAADALGWSDINGGYSKYDSACRVLERCGYSIVDKNGRPTGPKREAEAAVQDFNAELEGLDGSTRDQIVRARIGQNLFRSALMKRAGETCEITGISDGRLLRASHIKAWAQCTSDRERLDPQNGLLLSALWDAAFDAGLVTFSDDGAVIVSSRLDAGARKALNVSKAFALWLDHDQSAYMKWHRDNTFIK